jgi:hypothetical protein
LHRERKGLRSHGRQVALVFVLSAAAFAQTGAGIQTGMISGKIADRSDDAISGASIVVKDGAGNQFRATSTATGDYSIDKLPPGVYEVTVTASAMNPFVKKDFAVVASETSHLDVKLADGTQLLGTLGDGDRFSAAFFAGQKTPPPPTGPAPRLPDGKPDLSGFWQPPEGQPDQAEPLPWADAIRRERQASNMRDDPYGRCLPRGIMSWAGQFKFVHTASMLVMLATGEPARQVSLGGGEHPRDLNPTWQGHSVGHWEGDTLVVDTVGFNALIWYAGGIPSTENLHVMERYRRIDLGHLETEITVEDSAVLRKPWTRKLISNLNPEGDIQEFICTENNKDPEHLVGK